MEKVFADNKFLTVFEFFMVEILRELLRQLKFESPSILIQPNQEHDSLFQTTWIKKNLFAPTYSRTVTNEKSLHNCLRKAYVWFESINFITFSLLKVSACHLN